MTTILNTRNVLISSAIAMVFATQSVATSDIREKVRQQHGGLSGSMPVQEAAKHESLHVNIGGASHLIDSKTLYQIQKPAAGLGAKGVTVTLTGADVISNAKKNPDYYVDYAFVGEK